MSLGEATSAPASAWRRAISARIGRVSSFCTTPFSSTRPQWPWLVQPQRQTSVITMRSEPKAFFSAFTATGTTPLWSQA